MYPLPTSLNRARTTALPESNERGSLACLTRQRNSPQGPHRLRVTLSGNERLAPPLDAVLRLALIVISVGGTITVHAEPCHAQAEPVASNQSRSDGRLLLDLSKKETFVVLSTNANPRNVVITDIHVRDLPTEHRLVPASGVAKFGHPLDIELKEPGNVRIRLAIVKRGKQLALRVSPQIVLGQDHAIDLTRDRVTRTARSMHRRLKDVNRQLITMSCERRALNIWLITPGNKTLESVKMAHMRMKLLDHAIREKRREVPVVKKSCLALGQAGEFVKKLHKTVEIRYSVKVVGAHVARRQSGD